MLPDFGWTELLVISIVLIVVIGPKDLPKVLRGFGKSMTSVRRMAGDFRKQFDDALKEAELDDVRTFADDMRSLDPRRQIREALDPLAEAGRDIDADMKKAMGDNALPELPKSPPQVGLDESGARARAAQATRRKGGASLKPKQDKTSEPPPAEPVATAPDAAKSSGEAPPPTAKARSKTPRTTAKASTGGPKTKRAAASAGTAAKGDASSGGTKTAAKGGATKGNTPSARKRSKASAAQDDRRTAPKGANGSTAAAKRRTKAASAGTSRSERTSATKSTGKRKSAKADAPASGGDNG